MSTLPENRTAQEWVDFYLAIENDVASGKVTMLNGRRLEFEDLEQIRKARSDWERRAMLEKSKATPRIGGLRYKTAAMN